MKIGNYFVGLPLVVSVLLASEVQAEIVESSLSKGGLGVQGCTASRNCTDEGWGIDLNDNTGYRWLVEQELPQSVELYVSIAVPSGNRAMSLWVNGERISTISSSASQSPRGSGREFGPFFVGLNTGQNSIELRDTEGTWEFDALNIRLESSGRSILGHLEAEENDSNAGLQFESTSDAGGGQNASHIQESGFIEWMINVPNNGFYTLDARSAALSDSAMEIYVDGEYRAELGIDATGGWQTWENYQSVPFYMSKGTRKLRAKFATAGQNLNWVAIESASEESIDFDTAQWRFISRNKRNTIERVSGGLSVVKQYHGLDSELWHIDSLQNNHFNIRSKESGECIAAENNSISLGSCTLNSARIQISKLREKTENRPAIYQLKNSTGLCIRPPADTGAMTMSNCGVSTRWYIETAGFDERNFPEEYSVRGLLIIKPETEISQPDLGIESHATISSDLIEGVTKSFTENVGMWMSRISDGRVGWLGEVIVSESPITELYFDKFVNNKSGVTWSAVWKHANGSHYQWNGTDQKFELLPNTFDPTMGTADDKDDAGQTNFLPKPENLSNDIQRLVKRGKYDTVQIGFTGGDLPGGWGWGPGASEESNYSLWATVEITDDTRESWESGNNEPTEVFIHEMGHGYDDYLNQYGIYNSTHGGDDRYGTYLERRGWVHFYRDVWLGQVITENDTYIGYGPRAFREIPPREWASNQNDNGINIYHRSSNMCLRPSVGVTPFPDAKVVFSNSCIGDDTKFILMENGLLKHVNSGMCIHPQGGEAREGKHLVFWPSCQEHDALKIELTEHDTVKNINSSRCVHPESDTNQPEEGEVALFRSGCDEDRLRFDFKR